jgi:DNA mismatch repair protein MutS2
MGGEAIITETSLAALGWPELREAIASRCRTPAGRREALSLPLLSSEPEVARSLARIEEGRLLFERGQTLPLGGVGEVEPVLERAGKEGMLDPPALLGCAVLMRAIERTHAFCLARNAECPGLWELAGALPDRISLAEDIEMTFDSSGAISDRASSTLAELRERVRALHRSLKGRVEGLLADEQVVGHLRDRYFTIRNDRYVLPVLASDRAALPGIVHNASQSGQTLFVEPQALVELGNELAIATAGVLEEEQRILRELSEDVAAEAASLTRSLAILSRLDAVEAAARLADLLDAHPPERIPPSEGFSLRSLRHPLLVLQKGEAVIASDVELLGQHRALVVSGPNGGGKTVAITAVGLSAVMLRAGLPVPAAPGSRLPCYGEVLAAIDARGDLHRDLSTFTAHLSAVRDIAASAGRRSLVLIDEIAADTDPREGAALAAGVVEDLLERGAQVLVTTHLDDLKALALSDARFENARVGFDATRLVPTFSLHLGSSGHSSALEVARRVGLPARALERAQASLSGKGGALGAALAALEEARAAQERERTALTRARETAAAAEGAAREREAAALRSEQEAEARVRAALAAEVESARREVAAMLAQLQTAPTVRKASETAHALARIAEQATSAERSVRAQAEAGAEALPGAVEAGMRVRIASLGQEGEVLDVSGDEAVVQAGPLKMRRPLADLVPLRGKARRASLGRDREARNRAAEAQRPQALEAPDRRLDVRGMRVEELLREMERFLDQLYREGEGECVVLHGHGTGALKQALREHLKGSPYVQSFRSGERHEGGDAVTVVVLKR